MSECTNKLSDSTSIRHLDIDTRAKNALGRGGYKTVRDVLNASPETLHNLRNMGDTTLARLYDTLEQMGFEVPKIERCKIVKLSIPKDRLKSGLMTVKFEYDSDTDTCSIKEIS